MTTTIISNTPQYSFGMQTNQAISRLISLNTQLARLGEAIATAASGYNGIAGTEYEAPSGNMGLGTPSNLFGVIPSETAGEQGSNYRYAMDSLNGVWATFWAQARPFIEQLDNGGTNL